MDRRDWLADSVGLALIVVLEAVVPAERVAFVLHDLFDLPYDEIAPIVGRSPVAARQLASRARRALPAETWHWHLRSIRVTLPVQEQGPMARLG